MPIIEPFATVSLNCPQRLCKLAYGEAFALFRCAATFEVQATRVRVLGQLFFMDCPIDRNARCDRKAVFSVADGRLQTSIKPKLPIVARQPRPRIDGARNGKDRKRVVKGKSVSVRLNTGGRRNI